jgi:hypothetical protein
MRDTFERLIYSFYGNFKIKVFIRYFNLVKKSTFTCIIFPINVFFLTIVIS